MHRINFLELLDIFYFSLLVKITFDTRSAEEIGKFEFLCVDILFNLRTQYLFPFYPRQQNEFMKTIKLLKVYLVSMVNYINGKCLIIM